MALVIIVMVSSFFVTAQRLHDRDRSAWWWLLFVPGSSVLGGAAEVVDDPGLALMLFVAALSVSIWAIVELGVLRGSTGDNRYGPDPLSVESPVSRSDEPPGGSPIEVAEPLSMLQFHDPDLSITRHAAGTTIVPQGDPAKEMFLVLEGRVRLERDGRTVEVIGAGGIFGEMALIDHTPPNASAIAMENTTLVPIDEHLFVSLIKETPSIALDVMRIHVQRMRRMSRTARQAKVKAKGRLPLETPPPNETKAP